jgi:nitrogen fixation protein
VTFLKGTKKWSENKDRDSTDNLSKRVSKKDLSEPTLEDEVVEEKTKGEFTTLKRGISWKEYRSYITLRTPDTKTIVRTRLCFLWKSQ